MNRHLEHAPQEESIFADVCPPAVRISTEGNPQEMLFHAVCAVSTCLETLLLCNCHRFCPIYTFFYDICAVSKFQRGSQKSKSHRKTRKTPFLYDFCAVSKVPEKSIGVKNEHKEARMS